MRHKKANVELQLIIWTRESHANVVNVRGTLKFCFLRWPESHPWNLAGKKVSIIWCIIETISTRYCRKFKKLKGLYDHCWGVLEGGSCCVKEKRACTGGGQVFLVDGWPDHCDLIETKKYTYLFRLIYSFAR